MPYLALDLFTAVGISIFDRPKQEISARVERTADRTATGITGSAAGISVNSLDRSVDHNFMPTTINCEAELNPRHNA
jgi:hypothetical protein